MKRIVILYDLIAREYWASNQIKKEFEKRGHKAMLFALNFEFHKAFKFAKHEGIDLLLIPSCYSKNDFSRVVMPFKRFNNKLITICMHSEQIGYEGRENDLLPSEAEAKNTMYHLSWGAYFTSLLISCGVKRNLIIEIGNLRLQEIFSLDNKFSRTYLSAKYNLDINKKWIIYCDSGTFLSYQIYNNGETVKENLVGAETANSQIKQLANIFLETTNIFNSLSNDFFNNYELIYRPHPGIHDTDLCFLDSRIRMIRDCTVYSWFKQVVLNVVFNSTSIFESDTMGVTSIILKPSNVTYDVVGVKEYTIISTKNEFEHLIFNLENLKIKSGIAQKYVGNASEHMISNFVERLLNITDNVDNFLEYNLVIKKNMKKLLTSPMANFMVIMFYNLKILKYIKYPRNFNMNKNEHPIFKDNYTGSY